MTKLMATLLAGAVLAVSAAAARAELADAPFAAKTVTERAAAVEALKAAADTPDKQMALAALAAFGALERFGQALHLHGFRAPRSMMLPMMRLPVPVNEHPEPLTYEAWRAALTVLVEDLEAAKSMLANIDADADIGIAVDLAALRFDLNGDGALSEDESVLGIFQAFNPAAARQDDGPTPPPVFRFDRADAYWLEGYANFLTANARLWLAHDFGKTFDTSFGLFFPGKPTTDDSLRGGWSEDAIFDAISLIHTISWPVIEPETRKAILTDLKAMVRLSRLNWQAIAAETDNEREWLPGPQQKGPHPLTTLEVTDEIVAGWHDALAAAEAVLDGKALVPHLRYPGQGVNLKRFIEDGTEFDLVLTLTGPGVKDYLENGSVVGWTEWNRVTTAFGRTGIAPFALWFN